MGGVCGSAKKWISCVKGRVCVRLFECSRRWLILRAWCEAVALGDMRYGDAKSSGGGEWSVRRGGVFNTNAAR